MTNNKEFELEDRFKKLETKLKGFISPEKFRLELDLLAK
jgi:hypothetical protein